MALELLSETTNTKLKRKKSELKKLEKKLAGLDSNIQKNLLSKEEFAQANILRWGEQVTRGCFQSDLLVTCFWSSQL